MGHKMTRYRSRMAVTPALPQPARRLFMSVGSRGFGAVLAALLAAGPVSARQVVLFDNLDPAGGFNTTTGWALSQSLPAIANDFMTPTGRFPLPLSQITVPLTRGPFGQGRVDLYLTADAAGRPGALLEAFHLGPGIPPGDAQPHPALIATSILHPALSPNTRYWLVASVAQYATVPGVYAGWQWNTTGDTNSYLYGDDTTGDWQTRPAGSPRGAFRVEASVPE